MFSNVITGALFSNPFNKDIYLFYVYECFSCALCVCLVSVITEEDARFPGTGVLDGY